MNKKTLERKIRRTLSKKGVEIVAGSAADRSLKAVAEATAEVSNAGERLVKDASAGLKGAAEKLRAKVHKATRP